MTLDEIRKKHNVGTSTGQTTEKPVETNTDAAGLAAIRKRHNVDNYVPSVTEKPNTITPTTPKAEKKSTPAEPVNIKAFGAYGSNSKQETTSRAGKTVNAGTQGTMSNFTNLFGWLKEADAMAAARDEADRAYTAQQNKELAESKGEKATAKTSAEQKKVYNEAHAKQKDIWSKYYQKADELSAMSEKNTAEAKEGLGAVGQTLVDLGVTGVQMLGDAAANAIVPGGGTASMIARVAGGSAQQARLEGKDIGDQSKAAVKSGAISFLTEKMFGAFGKLYGKGAADDIVEKVVSKVGKTNAGRNALRLLLNAAGEGVEEMTEDLLNAAADKVLKLGDGKVDVGEVLYDGLLGFMLGGFGGAPQIFNGNYRAKNEAIQITNMQKVFAKTVAENTTDPQIAQAAQAMVEKIDKGGSLSAEEIATLATAMDAIDDASQSARQSAEAEQTAQKPLTPVEAVVKAAKGEAGTQNEKLNIDNAAESEYSKNMNGGAVNDAGRGFAADSDGVSGLYSAGNTGYQRRSEPVGAVKHFGRVLSTQSQDTIRSRGVDVVETHDVSASSAAFSVALEDARAANTLNGWAVTPKSAEEIAASGVRVYMNENGSVGYGIAPDGDIEAVFANKGKGAPRLATASMIPEAIANGGTKLDCYGLGLVKLYSQHGFIPVAKVKFNPEYANDGWTPDKGTPDVYFMMATDFNPDSVVQNYGDYPVLTQAELDALPVMEYDEAYAYRDSLLEQQQSNLPEGMGAASAEFTGEMSPAEQWVAEAQATGDSALHPISDEQQQSLAEHQGRAPQELPKLDPMGNLTSKTASTLMNSGITSNEMSDAILNDAVKGKFSRIAYGDSEAVNKAEYEIENGAGRYRGALARWQGEVKNGNASKDSMVMGICLYNNAVQNGDYITAMDIAVGIVDLGKNSAQALQAVRLLNKLSPEGRIYVAAKATDKINRELQKRYGDKAPDIAVDETLYTDYFDALKSGDKEAEKAAWSAIEQNIANQIPSSWVDKVNAWRYLSMLGNLRTHGRNIIGNAGFAPVRMTKNVIGAGLEAVADAISPSGIEQTKAVLNPRSKADQALLNLAMADYANAEASIMSNGKYNDAFSGVEDKRTIYKLKPLEAIRKANSTALNVEDAWFAKPAYAESLASWLKANGYNAVSFTDGSMPAEKLDAARAYAIKEAQKATYRDLNALSEFVSSLRLKTKNKTANAVGNTVIEGILPFKKTPANILVRAVEYSPAGLIKTITADSVRLRKGNITAAEYIDNLSQGLTGTALTVLGAVLARWGVLSGSSSGDDKQDNFDKLRGKQNYAINVGDLSITLDWLAPESMPLFVGVEIHNNFADGGFSWDEAFTAITNMTAPMLDMSMLQGVNDALTGLDYSVGSALSTIITTAAGSFISQFLPTIFGQVERVFTENRQTTYVDRNSSLTPKTQRVIGKLLNKAPGEYNQIDYIDAWGRTESQGTLGERALNNLVDPAYVKKSGATVVDDELQRLYDLGNTGVFPQTADQATKINGEYLTADEYVEYAKKKGSVSLETVKGLISSTAYKNMSDEDKAAAIEKAYAYANEIAKQSVNSSAGISTWAADAKASGNAAQYIADKTMMQTADTDGNGSYSSVEKVRGLIKGGYSGYELVQKVREYMTSDSGNSKMGDLLENAQAANIADDLTLDVYEFYSSAKADKDEDGKTISGSKKQKVHDYINSLSLSAQQKRTLYYSFYKK